MNRKFKGPYLMGYDWGGLQGLSISHLKMPELNQKAFKVTVGTKVEKRTSAGISYDDFGDIVYKDDEFIVGSVTARIRKEWYNVMYIKIETRHQGYRFFQLSDNSRFEE
ncbi:hypothetical protein BASA84_000883 [Batrachochytrium salamandrivorans]|nr:hypothetical protein BASA84_000883 [Batrachochytrium salamandrivorans]